MFDILFRNAKVIDGTGNPWFYGDVGVEGGTVAAVLPPRLHGPRPPRGGCGRQGALPRLRGRAQPFGIAAPRRGGHGLQDHAGRDHRKPRAGRHVPRPYATYPHILGRYARELGVLSQEEAIRKMTSLTGPQDPAGAQGRHPARI